MEEREREEHGEAHADREEDPELVEEGHRGLEEHAGGDGRRYAGREVRR